MQIFRVLQVENFQYCGCCGAIWEFQDYSAFKCCNIMEAFRMLLEGCSFFSKSFHVFQKLINIYIYIYIFNWNAPEPTDS